MSDPERLKQLLNEAKDDMEKLDDWMKSQEPAPGVSYKDWARTQEQNEKSKVEQRRVAKPFTAQL
jgi:hypothetical protein